MNTVRGYQIAVYRKDTDQFTLDALAAHAGLHPAIVERFVDFGLVRPISRKDAEMLFDASALSRVRSISRLRSTLGINLAGVSVVLDLVDKVCALQRENRTLRSRQ